MESIKDSLDRYEVLMDAISITENEIIKLKALVSEYEYEASSIKSFLKDEMLSADMRRAIIHGWKLNISESSLTVIEEADLLPEEYWRVKREPDAMKIKSAIKNGEEVPGATIVKTQNLSLKQANN